MKNTNRSPVFLAVFALMGCSGPTDATRADDATQTQSLDSNGSGQNAERVTLMEVARDFATNGPITGVEVCATRVHGDPDAVCATTGADGTVSLSVRNHGDVRVTFSASSYVSANQLFRVRSDISTGTRLITTALATRLAGAVGARLDLTKAQPVITTYGADHGPLAGVSVSAPASGIFYYVSATGVPSTSLTATTAAGIAGIMNAAPGTYDILAIPPAGMSCDIAPYVPGDLPNSIRVEGLAGSAGEARFNCHKGAAHSTRKPRRVDDRAVSRTRAHRRERAGRAPDVLGAAIEAVGNAPCMMHVPPHLPPFRMLPTRRSGPGRRYFAASTLCADVPAGCLYQPGSS